MSSATWHRLSNKRLDVMIADCSVCGADVPVARSNSSVICKTRRKTTSKASDKNYRSANRDKHRGSARQWLEKNKDRVRARVLRRKFGMSHEEYVSRVTAHEARGGGCATCGGPPTGRSDTYHHLDHCHTTGLPRDFLCANCNLSLGLAKDDPALLRILADYVEKWEQIHAETLGSRKSTETTRTTSPYEDGPFGGKFVDDIEVHWPPLPGDHALPLRQRAPVHPELVEALRGLANPYGAMGVAKVAARLTDPSVLAHLLFDDRETAPAAESPAPPAECTPACSEMHRFEPGCALAPAVEGTTPTDEDAQRQVQAAMQRVAEVFASHGWDEMAGTARLWGEQFGGGPAGELDVWAAAARALLAGGDPT